MSNPHTYYKYNNEDPSIKKNAEISVNEILDLLDKKINKDIFRIYRISIKSILGQDLAHAIIRLLSYQLAQRVKNINDFEKNDEGDLRHFTNSADVRNHFDLGSEQEDHK
jgi:hypothetical protein